MDANTYTIFLNKITALGFKTYEEYLDSDLWQQFRKKYFRSKKTKKFCLVCLGDDEFNFSVELHHLTYERLGQERLNDVIPLCREHHEQVHEILKQRYNNDIRWSERVVHSLTPGRGSRGKGLLGGRKRRGGRARGFKRGSGGLGESADD